MQKTQENNIAELNLRCIMDELSTEIESKGQSLTMIFFWKCYVFHALIKWQGKWPIHHPWNSFWCHSCLFLILNRSPKTKDDALQMLEPLHIISHHAPTVLLSEVKYSSGTELKTLRIVMIWEKYSYPINISFERLSWNNYECVHCCIIDCFKIKSVACNMIFLPVIHSWQLQTIDLMHYWH